MNKRMSTEELQTLGNKLTRIVTAKINRTLAAAQDSLSENLSDYDLDRLLLELETELSSSGIDAIFYPI